MTNEKHRLEKLSCAYTLSDMEIFVFPELMHSLVIANIMSPIIWEWKKNSWFKDIDTLSPLKKLHKIKQFIIDNFVFNLDLDTWGLTTKEKEIERFKDFIDLEILKKSNALFGYEGGKYYFDIDIRKHFGLENHPENIVPYWKTETIEAMTAFKHKPEYNTGAGECVSLSALYSAALFIIGKIPLENIFMIGTPLHSQNLILHDNGILTNNRRLLTKTMWFNGTETSAKARRALENETITLIAHLSGYIHTSYKKATIHKDHYLNFKETLTNFLKTPLTSEIFINFLRHQKQFQKCFQIAHNHKGKIKYIELEKAFSYEHSSKLKLSDASRKKLLSEVFDDEFHLSPLPDKLIINKLEQYLNNKKFNLDKKQDRDELKNHLCSECARAQKILPKLNKFLVTKPKLPASNKDFIEQEYLKITTNMRREQIIEYIKNLVPQNDSALYAMHSYRDFSSINWEPFIKSAIERNPVSIEGLKNKNTDEIFHELKNMDNNSIYTESRLALPDEIWNFKRGDGIEKAILLA
ncbi:hypothetical protein KKC59_04690, partial [bacterium]|nr:hypothetical protein [bacterium]